MKNKKIIFDFKGDWNTAKPFYVESITVGLTNFLLRNDDIANKVRDLGKVEIIGNSELNNSDFLLLSPSEINQDVDSANNLAVSISLSSKDDEKTAIKLAANEHVKMIIVEANDWKVIPLENLIAEFQKLDTYLIAKANDINEASLFLETLETGVDGVFFSIDTSENNLEDINFGKMKELTSFTSSLQITPVEITKIEEVGSGDRVCVDTISLLKTGEGILVGSQAKGFFLVHGETADTEFVNARPFRVNAGAVHSYTLLPENKTTYLSELKAGESVLIVDINGNTRISRVGRAKIETRPMLLIEARKGDEFISCIIQNAETICLVDNKGNRISVSKLKIGDQVLAYLTGSKGRHFGKDINEKIIEK